MNAHTTKSLPWRSSAIAVITAAAVGLTGSTAQGASALSQRPVASTGQQSGERAAQDFETQWRALAEGASLNLPGVQGVTVTKREGRAVVEARTSAPGVSGLAQLAQDAGFCHALAMAAVLTIGAGALALMAASGGAVVFGVFLAPSVLAEMSAALTIGAGLEALVSLYIC
jgi:hypothetical protein